jgi:hypothetical protein
MKETVLIVRYHNMHIKEVEMGKACGTHGREEKYTQKERDLLDSLAYLRICGAR